MDMDLHLLGYNNNWTESISDLNDSNDSILDPNELISDPNELILDSNDSILDLNDSKDSVLGLNLDLEMSESEKIFVRHTLDACLKRKKKYSENRTAAMQLIQDKKTSQDDDDGDDFYVNMLLNGDGIDGMNVLGEEEDGNVEEMLLLEKKEKMRLAMEALSSDNK